jgi:glycosyltransferase involved in cell wall biosynthesis
LTQVARLVVRIRRSRIQLIHVNEHEHYSVVSHAARLAGVPTVVHVRFRVDAAMCQWLFKPPYQPERLFFTSQTQLSDVADAVSTTVPKERWRLIYNGLDFTSFGCDHQARQRVRAEWSASSSSILIGTASSISPRKRLGQFIRLVANLIQAGVDVRGFIAGQPYFPEDHAELSSLRELTRVLGVQDRVTFLGYVEPSEPLYHAWDICVSTSEYETFGMTVLEAMGCGCPVVTYPGGSVAEVVGDGGFVVDDGDLAGLTVAVGRLAADPALRARMSSRARSRAEHFDVHRSVEQLAAEYRAVVG